MTARSICRGLICCRVCTWVKGGWCIYDDQNAFWLCGWNEVKPCDPSGCPISARAFSLLHSLTRKIASDSLRGPSEKQPKLDSGRKNSTLHKSPNTEKNSKKYFSLSRTKINIKLFSIKTKTEERREKTEKNRLWKETWPKKFDELQCGGKLRIFQERLDRTRSLRRRFQRQKHKGNFYSPTPVRNLIRIDFQVYFCRDKRFRSPGTQPPFSRARLGKQPERKLWNGPRTMTQYFTTFKTFVFQKHNNIFYRFGAKNIRGLRG